MELSNRGPQVNNVNVGQTEGYAHRAPSNSGSSKKRDSDWNHNRIFRIVQVVLTFCILIVVIGLIAFLAISDTTTNSESGYVESSKLQAVFLNTGQVYFGNITRLNNIYVVLTNIFYLQTSSNGSSSSSSSSSSSTSNNVTLVKLGCEIHAPLDQMVINRTSVTFWENLSPTGQVAKAVSTWEKDNPDGQKCSDQSTAGTSGQSTPQNATNNSSSSSSTK